MNKIITTATAAEIEQTYEKALSYFGPIAGEIKQEVKNLSGNVKLFTKYIYASLPVSDAGSFPFSVVKSYAEHAVFLLENSPFIENVPEDIFLNYVVSARINSEDLCDCRRFFYDMVADSVCGLSMEEAVLALNNWCFAQATYQATSSRTASPLTVYKGGFGRCGEESTFLTTVLRSVGIPARQVYVPRWSHCDDNHAWTEVWVDGTWKYTGACEPKPVLNNGWFTYAASRAMLIHSRTFSSISPKGEEFVEQDGIVTEFNSTSRYAKTDTLKVVVKDSEGQPIKNARVAVEIVNEACFFPMVTLISDEQGAAEIRMGLGTVLIHAMKDGISAELFADTRTDRVVHLVLSETSRSDVWQDFEFIAPDPSHVSAVEMTEEQDAFQNELNAQNEERRNLRIAAYFDARYASQFAGYKGITRALQEAKGNFEQIRMFLDDNPEANMKRKNAVLSTISKKDCRDIRADVLGDMLGGFDYENNYEQDIFEKYVLAGRIDDEWATPYHAFLKAYCAEHPEIPVADPKALWNWIEREIVSVPEREYRTVCATPEGTLKTRKGSPKAKRILFVAVCRTFGLAARLDPAFYEPQVYVGNDFISVRPQAAALKTAEITLMADPMGNAPEPFKNFTLNRRTEEGNYVPVGLWGHYFEDGKMVLHLTEGQYRLVVAERLASGSIRGSLFDFFAEDAAREIVLRSMDIDVKNFFKPSPLGSFTLIGMDGSSVESSSLGGQTNVFMFVEPGKEPTEHLFNELLELYRTQTPVPGKLHVILRPDFLWDQKTFRKFMEAYPEAVCWQSDFKQSLEAQHEATGADTTRLPVITVAKGAETAVYGWSGYQIGSAELLARLTTALEKENEK